MGEHLADIHGQHDRQVLLELPAHLQWLDRFGGNLDDARQLRTLYRGLRECAAQLESLKIDEQERLRQMDVLHFQLDEIRRAALRPGEKEELESEKRILANRERVYALSSEAYALLYENEPSMLAQASRLVKILQELDGFDPGWAPRIEALQDVVYRLEDLSYAARDYTSGIDFTPGRLDEIEQRLEELEKLARKYGSTLNEIIAYGGECSRRLDELASRSETLESLSADLIAQKSRYLERARKLSDKRRRDSTRLEREIRREFAALSMEKMELSVRFHQKQQDDTAATVPPAYGPCGLDRVEFLIAANRGEEARPLAKTASGGSCRGSCSPSEPYAGRATAARLWCSTRWTLGSAGASPRRSDAGSARSRGQTRSSASRICPRLLLSQTGTSRSGSNPRVRARRQWRNDSRLRTASRNSRVCWEGK